MVRHTLMNSLLEAIDKHYFVEFNKYDEDSICVRLTYGLLRKSMIINRSIFREDPGLLLDLVVSDFEREMREYEGDIRE